VLEVDARSGRIVRTWPTGAEGGWFVAVTPDERRLFVPHLEGERVTAVDRHSGETTVVASGGPQSGIDVSPGGAEVWVMAHEQQVINIFAAATGNVIDRFRLASPEFGRLRFTPDGRRVVLVQGRRATVIDAAARAVLASIEMARAGKVVAVSPDGRSAAVSNPDDGHVTIIDLDERRVTASHRVGQAPDGIVWVRRPGAS
jgi:DNA-binding beta-propeller fold protein YncE